MDYLKKSAETGYAQAQAWMALTYSQGYGVEKNAAEAARWLQRLAQQNSPEAWYWLGRCYSGGWGVEKDPIQAAQWYQKAAEQGDKNAQRPHPSPVLAGKGQQHLRRPHHVEMPGM